MYVSNDYFIVIYSCMDVDRLVCESDKSLSIMGRRWRMAPTQKITT